MKKIIILFELIFALVSFAACGGGRSEGGTSAGDVTVENDVTPGAADNTRDTVAEPVAEDPAGVMKTADEIKGIAFTDAGVSEADVRDLRVELDRDNAREEFEVDFKVERVEYSYDIDAYTGEILKKEKDMD